MHRDTGQFCEAGSAPWYVPGGGDWAASPSISFSIGIGCAAEILKLLVDSSSKLLLKRYEPGPGVLPFSLISRSTSVLEILLRDHGCWPGLLVSSCGRARHAGSLRACS